MRRAKRIAMMLGALVLAWAALAHPERTAKLVALGAMSGAAGYVLTGKKGGAS